MNLEYGLLLTMALATLNDMHLQFSSLGRVRAKNEGLLLRILQLETGFSSRATDHALKTTRCENVWKNGFLQTKYAACTRQVENG